MNLFKLNVSSKYWVSGPRSFIRSDREVGFTDDILETRHRLVSFSKWESILNGNSSGLLSVYFTSILVHQFPSSTIDKNWSINDFQKGCVL